MTVLADAFQRLLAAFNALNIPYLVGGSVASGSYGLPRQAENAEKSASKLKVSHLLRRAFAELSGRVN